MAATMAGRILAVRSSSSFLFFSKRLFSSSSSIAKAPSFYGFVRSIGSTSLFYHSVRFAAPAAIRFNQIRCIVNFSKQPLFAGLDHKHWLTVMDTPGGEDANKQQMIDCYIQTLAKVLGSEEEAKKKIYKVSCEEYFGFGCEIDEETSKKLQGLPGVLFVLADSYVLAEDKDYGGELFVDGEIVKRSPERQERMDAYQKYRKLFYRRNLESDEDEETDECEGEGESQKPKAKA